MRIHNDFTLYWRDLPSGKRVVYFYAYDENKGDNTAGQSPAPAAADLCVYGRRYCYAGECRPVVQAKHSANYFNVSRVFD